MIKIIYRVFTELRYKINNFVLEKNPYRLQFTEGILSSLDINSVVLFQNMILPKRIDLIIYVYDKTLIVLWLTPHTYVDIFFLLNKWIPPFKPGFQHAYTNSKTNVVTYNGFEFWHLSFHNFNITVKKKPCHFGAKCYNKILF